MERPEFTPESSESADGAHTLIPDPRLMSSEERMALIQGEVDSAVADDQDRIYRSEREIRRIARRLRVRNIFRLGRHDQSTIDPSTRSRLTDVGLLLYDQAFPAVGTRLEITEITQESTDSPNE